LETWRGRIVERWSKGSIEGTGGKAQGFNFQNLAGWGFLSCKFATSSVVSSLGRFVYHRETLRPRRLHSITMKSRR
jgi:hypothetical protein